MLIKNTQRQYGWATITLHWVMALLMIGLTLLGLYMVTLPISLKKLKFYTWHKEMGMVVLGLASFRLVWRLVNFVPDLTDMIPAWQQVAARMAHWFFYLLMVTLPVTGWLIISAAGVPLSFYGWFVFPSLVEKSREWMDVFILYHVWLSYTFIVLLIVHTSAALLHHLYYRDNVLKRIIRP